MTSVIMKIAFATTTITLAFIPVVRKGLSLALQSRFQFAPAFDVLSWL